MSTVEWQRVPILISTSSIALQKSALTYIKDISKILTENVVIDSPLRISLRKGRSNYVCEYNLCSHIPYERDPGVLAALNCLIVGTVIDLAEADGLTHHIKKKICVPEKCRQNCPHSESCGYLMIEGGIL
jgi:Rad3-related DNA helicase